MFVCLACSFHSSFFKSLEKNFPCITNPMKLPCLSNSFTFNVFFITSSLWAGKIVCRYLELTFFCHLQFPALPNQSLYLFYTSLLQLSLIIYLVFRFDSPGQEDIHCSKLRRHSATQVLQDREICEHIHGFLSRTS